jgi:hypothetical protein
MEYYGHGWENFSGDVRNDCSIMLAPSKGNGDSAGQMGLVSIYVRAGDWLGELDM